MKNFLVFKSFVEKNKQVKSFEDVISLLCSSFSKVCKESVCVFRVQSLSDDSWLNKVLVYGEDEFSSELIQEMSVDIEKTLLRLGKSSKIDSKKIPDSKSYALFGFLKNRPAKKAYKKNIFIKKNILLEDSGKVFAVLSVAIPRDFERRIEFYETIDFLASIGSQAISRIYFQFQFELNNFNQFIDKIGSGIIIFDPNGRIVALNKLMEKIGARKNSGIGDFLANIHDVKRYFSQEKLVEEKIDLSQEISRSFVNNSSLKFEEVAIKDKFYELFLKPVNDCAILVLHDITHLKEVNRMKSEFVSVASHQLRTPLTAIRLFSEMLINNFPKNGNVENKEYLENIYQSALIMINLVNDLLNLSRIEAGKLEVKPTRFTSSSFIGDIIKNLSILAKDHKVKLSYSGKDVQVFSDNALLAQVLYNLVSNAIHYNFKNNGTVHVEIKTSGGNIVFSVKDNGIGISTDNQAKIFEKFFRADNAVKMRTSGNGLGLYISRIIVDRLGGKIWFKSSLGKGTTFFVSLPKNFS